MRETSKATARRLKDNSLPWRSIFSGKGIDLGPGDDPLLKYDWAGITKLIEFDKEQGDANKLSGYFAPEIFDFIHASQCLEHLYNPTHCLKDWLTLLKPGGHIVASWPDYDLYEKRARVSLHNPDHKAFFSLWRKGYPGAELPFIHVPDMLESVCKCGATVLKSELIATNYDWNAPDHIDQTLDFEKGVEAFIEVLLVKNSK